MVTLFDHYSDQEHTAKSFREGWGEHPWDDANIPVGLFLREDDDGNRVADFLVFHPRKEHVKHVRIKIQSDEDLEFLRSTLRGVGEAIYGPAASALERFAHGEMPEQDPSDGWGGLVLYYWHEIKDW